MDYEDSSDFIPKLVSYLICSFFVGTIIALIFYFSGSGKYEGQNAEFWFNEYDEEVGKTEKLESRIEDLDTALEEANDNITSGNENITAVKNSNDVPELKEALNNLDIISTVDVP
jgi:hypothetical protein